MSAGEFVVTGRIRTMAGVGEPYVEAVRIRDGKIVETGPRERLTGGDVKVLDFGDRVVLPAFVDPHAHLEITSRALDLMVDVRVPKCRTVADVLDALRDGLAEGKASSGWLSAQANLFFNQKLADGRYPNRQELDQVSDTVPISIHAGGHSTLLNTPAMEASQVDRFMGRHKGAMGGAVVELDADGKPSGLVSEIDAMLPVPEPSEAELRQALRRGASELFTRHGVTVIGEMSDSRQGLELMGELSAGGELPQRVEVFVCAPGTVPFEEALDAADWLGQASPRVAQRGVKVFSDGGYSAKNAATRTPYRKEHAVRPGSRGKINLNRRELASLIRRAGERDLQLAVHANGERAQDGVCAAAAAQAPGATHPPTRAEHAGNLLTEPSALDSWRQAGIVPVPQPVFLYNFGDFFPVYLGPVAEQGRFPFRMLLDEGFRIAGSSDVYLGAEDRQTNPFFGIWCCLKRETFLEQIIEPDQRVTLDEALRMHTVHAAETLGVADRYGSIEPGKEADLIVLDRDPDSTDADGLLDIKVDHVFVAGEVVHSREGAAEAR